MQPLFMYVPYQAVHSPRQVPESYTEQYDFIKNEHRRVYAGMVTAMDEGIGNITNTLKELGMWDDTILIFSSGKCFRNWPKNCLLSPPNLRISYRDLKKKKKLEDPYAKGKLPKD